MSCLEVRRDPVGVGEDVVPKNEGNRLDEYEQGVGVRRLMSLLVLGHDGLDGRVHGKDELDTVLDKLIDEEVDRNLLTGWQSVMNSVGTDEDEEEGTGEARAHGSSKDYRCVASVSWAARDSNGVGVDHHEGPTGVGGGVVVDVGAKSCIDVVDVNVGVVVVVGEGDVDVAGFGIDLDVPAYAESEGGAEMSDDDVASRMRVTVTEIEMDVHQKVEVPIHQMLHSRFRLIRGDCGGLERDGRYCGCCCLQRVSSRDGDEYSHYCSHSRYHQKLHHVSSRPRCEL